MMRVHPLPGGAAEFAKFKLLFWGGIKKTYLIPQGGLPASQTLLINILRLFPETI
jgi:hypothetical protein